jgi:hypothetical protein
VVGDAAADSGTQTWTTTDSNGTARFKVIVIGSACYFQGDALALVEQLDVDPTTAQAHANQWISLLPSDVPYASVYVAVNTGEALSDNITVKPEQLGSTTLEGRKFQTVSGAITPVTVAGQVQKIDGTATLDVSTSTHLPVRYSQGGKSGKVNTSSTTTFSNFGETVSEIAPPGAIAYSSLGSSGGGGSSSSPSVLT